MKKFIAMMIVLALIALTPAVAEANPEQADFFDQARDWWSGFSADLSGWGQDALDWSEGVVDQIAEGTQELRVALEGYLNDIHAWLDENYPTWNEEVRQAWDTLREAAMEGTELAKSKAQEAYETLKGWLEESGEPVTEQTEAAIDAMAAAAGVVTVDDADALPMEDAADAVE